MSSIQEKNQLKKSSHFLSGALSGSVTACLFQPFDVLRTQQQGTFASHSSKTMVQTMQQMIQQEGMLSLWKGTTPTLIRVSVGAGLYFGILNHLLKPLANATKEKNQNHDNTQSNTTPSTSGLHSFLAGATARSLVGILVCPLTIIKSRMEWHASTSSTCSMSSVIRQIYKQDGTHGFFRGIGPTIARDAPFSGFYVLLYTSFLEKQVFELESNPTLNRFCSGVCAGLIATAISHPADTLRTRIQLSSSSELASYTPTSSSTWSILKQFIQKEGIGGFYRGVWPRLMKRTFSTAFTWTIYEEVLQLYRHHLNK